MFGSRIAAGAGGGSGSSRPAVAAFSDDELFELAYLFKRVDADGSGGIDQSELKRIFRALDLSTTKDEVDLLFKELDDNNDGVIKYPEFEAFMSFGAIRSHSGDQMKAAFKLLKQKTRHKRLESVPAPAASPTAAAAAGGGSGGGGTTFLTEVSGPPTTDYKSGGSASRSRGSVKGGTGAPSPSAIADAVSAAASPVQTPGVTDVAEAAALRAELDAYISKERIIAAFLEFIPDKIGTADEARALMNHIEIEASGKFNFERFIDRWVYTPPAPASPAPPLGRLNPALTPRSGSASAAPTPIAAAKSPRRPFGVAPTPTAASAAAPHELTRAGSDSGAAAKPAVASLPAAAAAASGSAPPAALVSTQLKQIPEDFTARTAVADTPAVGGSARIAAPAGSTLSASASANQLAPLTRTKSTPPTKQHLTASSSEKKFNPNRTAPLRN